MQEVVTENVFQLYVHVAPDQFSHSSYILRGVGVINVRDKFDYELLTLVFRCVILFIVVIFSVLWCM